MQPLPRGLVVFFRLALVLEGRGPLPAARLDGAGPVERPMTP